MGKIKKGMVIWIPCEVKNGPFPNERRVYVQLGQSEWFGFVDLSHLKEEHGQQFVRTIVLAVRPSEVVLGIRGQSPASGPIQASPSLIAQYGTVTA